MSDDKFTRMKRMAHKMGHQQEALERARLQRRLGEAGPKLNGSILISVMIEGNEVAPHVAPGNMGPCWFMGEGHRAPHRLPWYTRIGEYWVSRAILRAVLPSFLEVGDQITLKVSPDDEEPLIEVPHKVNLLVEIPQATFGATMNVYVYRLLMDCYEAYVGALEGGSLLSPINGRRLAIKEVIRFLADCIVTDRSHLIKEGVSTILEAWKGAPYQPLPRDPDLLRGMGITEHMQQLIRNYERDNHIQQ